MADMSGKVSENVKNQCISDECNLPEVCESKKTTQDDPELDDLLDDALGDFSKPANTQQTSAAVSSQPKQPSVPTDGAAAQAQEELFNQLFDSEASDESTKQFEAAMKQMLSNEPDIVQQFEKLSQSAGSADNSADSQKEFMDTLQNTLGSLAENAQNLQGDMSEEDLLKSMSGLGLDPGGGEGGDVDFMPMMQGMMKSLLSKDVLYPSLKEISEKYPTWLGENKEKIAKEELDRFQKQQQIMDTICVEFEQEKESDPEDMKKKRFDKILDLMQKMQEYGQPPKDIVGEMAPGLQFDAQGNPQLPGMNPEQCSVM